MGVTDLTGKTIGSYQVLRKLGQGGMATVYQAHEQSLNREVALKVIADFISKLRLQGVSGRLLRSCLLEASIPPS